ncbi:MAG: helix-turn-helix domain-containing protein [Parcubacteria group bacterium]|nr:helix-turn-helix domain-containing protein [Parcubacteria group bacterium]
MEKQFKVRDLRKKEQFIIDDSYLNGYAKIFGPGGTAVYLSLCRRANKEQFCFPSEKTIAEDHNITDRTARTHIKRLIDARILRVERERSKSGKWLHNVYYLLDKSEWKTPEEIFSSGYQRKLKTKPTENNGTNQRKQIPLKETYVKDAHDKGSASPSANADVPMDLKEFVEWCNQSPQRHIQIIGIWADTEEPNFTTKKQWEAFIKRNLRAAKDLMPFEDERLKQGYKRMREAVKEGWLKKYSLETLLKFIV